VRRPSRESLIPLALVVGSYVLALAQRPGEASSDTKIDLHVDPVGFLGDVAQVWTPTGSLGHVQGGQYGGYLWPMGPFFAGLHSIGVPDWVVRRLWLGTLLALAAWGTVKLLDALLGRPRGVAHALAGTLMVLNPYVVVFANRTSVTLLAYAALPWLLLAVHRGLRDPRRWFWPIAFALIVTSTGGGVNAAVTAWVLVAPLLLVLSEPIAAHVPWRDVRAFGLRCGLATGVASIWWVVPVLVHAGYGIDFLKFTEQIGAIWGTTSLTESLRLMGYWPSYLGVGYGDTLSPYFGDSGTLLFDPAVVTATLLLPALALAGFVWTRRWRYGPFFLLLAMVGLLAMTVGFPEGTPLRKAFNFTYNHVQAVQFLRTTYKAAPLVALAVACLGGVAAGEAWRRLAAPRARLALAAVAAALAGLAALPLLQGRAVDAEVTWDRVPAAWTDAAAGLERDLPPQSRTVVLPGQPFAFYRWGGTIDPILPALTERPVAVRNVPPYADLHAVDLLWTVDNMVQQQRLVPGQLPPLLDLLGARAVVTATDDDFDRSGATPPAEAAVALRDQPGFERPARQYGPARRFDPPAGTLDPGATLPEVRRYDFPSSRSLVRLAPAGGGVVVDGSAEGVAGLAALGALPRDGAALRYAGDLGDRELRSAAAGAAEVVVSDSNRRRVFVATRSRQATGPTLAADDEFSADAAVLDPFPLLGADAQTVAVYRGARYVRAPASPQVAQFPEQRPFAAFDGDSRTAWLADPTLEDARHWVEIGFDRPRDVPYVDVQTYDDPRVTVTQLDVGGRRFDVKPGWNRLALGLRGATALRVAIADQRTIGDLAGSAGGLREVRVPGLHPRELLRPPVRAERALRQTDLRGVALSYVFSRTTADEPFRRGPVAPAPPRTGNRAEAEAALVRGAQDPESGIARLMTPPAARSWVVDGLATVAPAAADWAVDALAGTRLGGARAWSSGRFEGRPEYRASSAFDGGAARGWVAPWSGPGSAWLAWRTPRAELLRSLRIAPPRVAARAPARVRIVWDGGRTGPLGVGADGAVALPGALRSRQFKLEVLAVGPGRAGVGIGELSGAGLPRAVRSTALPPSCGSLVASVGGQRVRLALSGSVRGLDAGRPLRVVACDPPVSLPGGRSTEVLVPGGELRPLVMRLRSAAPQPRPAAAGGGRVVDPGRSGRGSHDGIRVEVRGPSWLVLGESYNRGWRATCDGRDLGEPAVVDAFANGWRVDRGCHDVAFAFAPQRMITIAYVVGGLACVGLLALMLLSGRRRRRRQGGVPDSDTREDVSLHTPEAIPVDDAPRPLPLARAAALAAAIGAACAFAFALRAGAVALPLAFLILWRGVPTRTLILAAGGLLAVVVPALYLLFPADDRGGYNTEYSVDHLGAHWAAVAAVVLLALALGRTLSTASRRRGGPAPEPAAEASPPVPA
jgi:hypothetical protein